MVDWKDLTGDELCLLREVIYLNDRPFHPSGLGWSKACDLSGPIGSDQARAAYRPF